MFALKCRKFKPKRYQLTKQATSVVVKGHPWVFRSHLSSAASVFDAGQWLRLVSAGNEVVGYGVIESTGAIAIRVLRAGKEYPGVEYWKSVSAYIESPPIVFEEPCVIVSGFPPFTFTATTVDDVRPSISMV